MLVAAHHPQEKQRVLCLQRLNHLDTPAEDRFDRLTRLAQRHFGVAGAMVTLVDDGRQWFKSTRGTLTVETPREISFCAHTILGEVPLVVSNLTVDPRFEQNPVVHAMSLRFYAGVPLQSPEGLNVGTFCLLDTREREFTQEEMAALQDFAACAEGELQRIQLTETESTLLAEMDELRRRSCLDEESRAWNATMIGEILAHEHARSRRLEQPLGIILLKLPPDAQGMRDAAEAARRCMRPYDSLGRLGDNELLIVVPGAPAAACLNLARRIAEPLGVPCGVASDAKSAPQLIESARSALGTSALQGTTVAHRDEASTEGMRAHSFGCFEATRMGQAVTQRDWKTNKTKFLLAFLLSEKGRGAVEEVILEAFWPQGGDAGKQSLRAGLSALRAILRPALREGTDPCLRQGERISLNEHLSLWSDVDEFVSSYESAMQGLERGDASGAVGDLNRCVAVYKGPYLEGYYGDWAIARRARFEEMCGDALATLARLESERGQHKEAVAHGERLLALTPERQDVAAVVFRSLLALGRPEAVVSRFKELKKVLRVEFESEPTLELLELHQRALLGIC